MSMDCMRVYMLQLLPDYHWNSRNVWYVRNVVTYHNKAGNLHKHILSIILTNNYCSVGNDSAHS